jgi:hypothetical protein
VLAKAKHYTGWKSECLSTGSTQANEKQHSHVGSPAIGDQKTADPVSKEVPSTEGPKRT